MCPLDSLSVLMIVTLTLVSCGSERPRLPTPLQPKISIKVGDVSPMALIRDRKLGRSGYACVDCHRVPGMEASLIRPAPGFGQRVGGLTPSPALRIQRGIKHCVERYLMRAPLSARTHSILANWLDIAVPASRQPSSASGTALFDRACRHCHDDGPAVALLTTPLRRSTILQKVLKRQPDFHPSKMMPPFMAQHLTPEEAARIADYLAQAARYPARREQKAD